MTRPVTARTRHARGRTIVALSRGACYGPCPEYVVRLASDGQAAWDGFRHVEPLGRHRGFSDPASVERIAVLARALGFFELEGSGFFGGVTDCPTYTLEVRHRGDRKVVTQNGTDEPLAFWPLAELIDDVGAEVRWWPAPRPVRLPETDDSGEQTPTELEPEAGADIASPGRMSVTWRWADGRGELIVRPSGRARISVSRDALEARAAATITIWRCSCASRRCCFTRRLQAPPRCIVETGCSRTRSPGRSPIRGPGR